LRTQISALDKLEPVSDIRTMDEYLSESVAEPRSYMSILGAFALISLVLAGVGIYGVVSHSVTERTHEIGVRMALGATRVELLKMILRRGMAMSGGGIVIGLVGAFGLGRLISTYLYGITSRDAPTLLMISVILAIVGLAACLIPARRAALLDPVGALRYE
jgi:putative ABC transport system permease protein